VIDFLDTERIRNTVILTGDIHSSWGYDVARDPWRGYDQRSGRGTIAVEFATPAISSPGWASSVEASATRGAEYMKTRPHLHWVDGFHRGYVVVDLQPKQVQADWYFVPTVTEKSTQERFAKGFVSEAGAPHLVEVNAPAG
jgi:alkaline phosphatase D